MTQTLLRQQLNVSLQLAEKFSRLWPAAPVLPAEEAQHVSPAQAAERAVLLGVPAGQPQAEQRPVPSGLHG